MPHPSPLARLARRALLATATAIALAATAPGAQAHDAPMPNDARHGLIVDEPWVMLHWVPFDEGELSRALSLRPGQLAAFLYNDHHTIAQLARQRGVGFEPLVERLSAWAATTAGADQETIRQRVRLMLVSGHLAQHVLGHVFHGMASTAELLEATELNQSRFSDLRADGWSYRSLIRRAGNDAGAVQTQLLQKVRANQDRGIEQHETPPRQATRMGDRQSNLLPCWFRRPSQLVDPAAPYGREYLKHTPGHTAADVPTTRTAQAREDRTLTANLTRRPPSCWPLPQRFTGDPGAPLTRVQLRALAKLPAGFKGPVNDRSDRRNDSGGGDDMPDDQAHADH